MTLDLQNHFDAFHKAIALGNYDDTEDLRTKRDLLVDELKKNLEDLSFDTFNQGSYAMHTGVVPKDGDYDIDVGLLFDESKDDHKPVPLKEQVCDALTRANRKVAVRRSCVTVEYTLDGEPQYHVDLAVYTKDPRENSDTIYIAKGKSNSRDDLKFWEESDPKGLVKIVNEKYTKPNEESGNPDDRAQMKRVIRYLKKWRETNFTTDKPYSISLTCAALTYFEPKTRHNGTHDDLEALFLFIDIMLMNFVEGKLEVKLPVVPKNDLNADMTDKQMESFKEALETLQEALKDASDAKLETDACKILRKQFGDDFPVPTKEQTSKKTERGFATAGGSA